MEAFRQTVTVKNHKISITLPDDFSFEEVDVIILPSQNKEFNIPQWQMDQVRERSEEYHKNPSIGLDFDEAMKIYNKVKHLIPNTYIDPQTRKKYDHISVNERLRFLKYDANQDHYFKPHYDGSFHRKDSNERSYLTIQIYLSGDCEGGQTRFVSRLSEVPNVDVKPEEGLVLVFDHRVLHEGCPLEKGLKYTIRSDIMYAPSFVEL